MLLLRDFDIKRKCYYKAVELLMNASGTNSTAQDLIGWASNFADNLRKNAEPSGGIQHISSVLNDLGTQVEEKMKEKAEGKVLRTPTGILYS